MRPLYVILAFVLVVLGGITGGMRADGALMPGVNTLADLLSRGEVTVNDVRYYGFTYQRRGANVPLASQVTVDAPTNGVGLTFSANWSTAVDGAQAVLLGFKASINPTIHQFASITTTLTGRSAGPTALAVVTDSIRDTTAPAAMLADTLVVADTAGGTFASTTSPLSPLVTDFTISKSLSLRSLSPLGSQSTVSTISTIFNVAAVPEPTGMMGVVLVMIGVAMCMRRRTPIAVDVRRRH